MHKWQEDVSSCHPFIQNVEHYVEVFTCFDAIGWQSDSTVV